jgi:hypothetical protein
MLVIEAYFREAMLYVVTCSTTLLTMIMVMTV